MGNEGQEMGVATPRTIVRAAGCRVKSKDKSRQYPNPLSALSETGAKVKTQTRRQIPPDRHRGKLRGKAEADTSPFRSGEQV
jgi:hypothetical protein